MTSAADPAPDRTPPLARHARAIASSLAGLVVLISLLALLGWVLDNALLKSVVPGTITMKVNTALGLILLAVALGGLNGRASAWRVGVPLCLAATLLLSLMTLSEYAFGVDLRIDTLLFRDAGSPRFPGRNAPATNFAFCGLAAAFALFHVRRGFAVGQALLFVVALTPLATLAGYVYRAPGMYQNAPYPAVAVNTSVALLLLCLGGLFARADAGLMRTVISDSPAGSLARTLLPAAVALPFLTGLIVLAGERAGLYSIAFGSALMVASSALFFAAAVCWSATLLSRTEARRALADQRRLQTERQVSEGEARLRIAIETARLGAWEYDPTTGRVEGSPQYSANFGRRPDEPLTYQSLLESVHPDDRARVAAASREAAAGNGEYRVEYRVVWPDGSEHWLVASGRGIRDAAGRPLGLVGVTMDVTAERAAGAVRERLLEAERRARAEAERSGRMKDEFLATLGHELRTPLSAILGWSQILRRPNAKPEAIAEGLAAIERNARVQTQIIGDLLDMSRIVSGKISIDARPTDLSPVIRAAIETVRAAAAAKGVRIRFEPRNGEVAPGGFPIVGDFNRLQQVFWNLLSNAIKFTPRGGGVEVRVALRDAQWHVDVADDGEGIAAEFLPYVFDRFRQADASTTRRHGGLGLGLAIVKQLVELHGGNARVRSEGVGKGSTFTVAFPADIAADIADDEPAAPDRAGAADEARGPAPAPGDDDGESGWGAPTPGDIRGTTIAILDDEADARDLLRRLLADCGANVLVATTADEAIAFVEHDRPDLLISDIGMPGEDGYALIGRVRRLGAARGGDVPAIALTAFARAEDRAMTARAGFHAHVCKPVETAELIAAIAGLVGRARA